MRTVIWNTILYLKIEALFYSSHLQPRNITLFRSITVFRGTDSIPGNIPCMSIRSGCVEYSLEYCQSHRTLLWIWIMLWIPIETCRRWGWWWLWWWWNPRRSCTMPAFECDFKTELIRLKSGGWHEAHHHCRYQLAHHIGKSVHWFLIEFMRCRNQLTRSVGLVCMRLHGYQNWNTNQVLVFGGYVKVRGFLYT